MKPIIKRLTSISCACLLTLGFTACEEDHKHAYEKAVTAPTCTEQGYTTYTCAAEKAT